MQLQTSTLFHKLFMFFYCREDNIPSCEAHKQFGTEPAQYGLEINFNTFGRNIYTLNFFAG